MLDTERALYRQTLSLEGAQFKPGGIHLPGDCFLFVWFICKEAQIKIFKSLYKGICKD